MAIGNSGLFVSQWIDVLDATQLALNLVGDVIKGALYTNSVTPNYSTDTAYSAAPYTSNEIASGGGYTTGGVTIATTTVTESPTGTLMFDATVDPAWTSSTITNARGLLVYDNTLAGKNAICLVSFGADYSTTSGTFTVQLASTGIFYIDLTP